MVSKFVHPMKFSGQYNGGYWAGYRFKEALDYTTGRHTGVDYNFGAGSDDKGLPIGAIAEGKIVLAKNLTSKGFGNTVIIQHTLPDAWAKEVGSKTLYSRYMHMENLNFASLRNVSVGEKIGTCGKSGTTAYHLHLDIWSAKNGLGAHEEYHKDTQLDSYLDGFNFIEAHAKELPVAKTYTEAQYNAVVKERDAERAKVATLNTQLQTLTKQMADDDAKARALVESAQVEVATLNTEINALTDIVDSQAHFIGIKDKEIKRLETLAGEEVTVGRAISVLVEAIKNLVRR